MQRHFKKTRRMLAFAAIAVPLLYFATFLLFAADHRLWMLVPFFSALILGLCFPIAEIADPDQPKRERSGPLSLLRAAAFALSALWAIDLPEANPLLDRLLGGALWDWKLITAAGIGALLAIHRGRQAASLLSDEMIFNYFTGEWPEKTQRLP